MKKFLILTGLLLFGFIASVFAAGTLTISKSAWVANPIAATNYTNVINVTCTGNCFKVQVVDTLPTGFSYIGSLPAATLTNGILSWFAGDVANSMTNSSQNFTYWGNVYNYTNANITNTAECFGTQGGDALGSTILAMATQTFTTISTLTRTPNWTATVTRTSTQTPSYPTRTAVIVRQTQTAVAAAAAATAAVTRTAVQQTAVAETATANRTPNMVNTMIAQTKTAVNVNALATVNAAYTATATYIAGRVIHATQTAVALRAVQTSTAGAVITATKGAIKTQTAAYYLTRTRTFTPTITPTGTFTRTITKTCTITPTYTATVNLASVSVPSSGGLFVMKGPLRLNIVQANAYPNTAAAVVFYNATSATGCVALNAALTISDAAAFSAPVVLYTGLILPDGIIRGVYFSAGLAVSGTASGAVFNLYAVSALAYWHQLILALYDFDGYKISEIEKPQS
jgi:hypothetical protein